MPVAKGDAPLSGHGAVRGRLLWLIAHGCRFPNADWRKWSRHRRHLRVLDSLGHLVRGPPAVPSTLFQVLVGVAEPSRVAVACVTGDNVDEVFFHESFREGSSQTLRLSEPYPGR